MVGAVVLFAVLVQGGGISRIEGVLLLLMMTVSLLIVSRASVPDPLAADVLESAEPGSEFAREARRTLVGLTLTITAAQLLLWGALDVSRRLDLSEGFVGATLIAIGTSLPELVTVVQSARRAETDLIVGNLLGSNLFNSLGVGGLIGLIGAPALETTPLTTVATGAAVVIAFAAFGAMVTAHTINRAEGIVLVVSYLLLVPFLA